MQEPSSKLVASCLVVVGAIALSCSSAPSSSSGTGGSTTVLSATGGKVTASGGSNEKGGASGGVVTAAGGKSDGGTVSSTAGRSGNGGRGGASSVGNGGSAGATGGNAAVGGAQTGGSARDAGPGSGGGPTGTGGVAGAATSGGAQAGGNARDGGAASAGGSTGGGGAAKPTAGCGTATFPASGKYNIDVDGTQRSYIIKLPAGFDNTKPFRLVMTWHGLGGSAERTADPGYEGAYYGLEPLSGGQAIFISGQGLGDSMGTGWPNTNDRDVKYVKALVDYLRKTYCIDDTRIFSVGKSYGGLFSNTLGCEMGDVFRAIAPQSSWLGTANPTCVGQTAVWIDHGTTDTTIDISRGKAARDLWLKNNHCGTTTKPWNSPETTCVAYDGCDADKPVIWCEFSGGHVMPSWASAAVWKFLMQF